MSASSVYIQIRQLLQRFVAAAVDESSRERLLLLVVGIIQAESVAPAAVAQALEALQLGPAQRDSLERRLRRIENDPEISAESCLYPLARHYLAMAASQGLLLVLDPTSKKDQIVKVSINLWYRNRTLPLVWTTWPAQVPLEGARFWQRIAALLDLLATLLPVRTTVTILADRAFGTPVFTDLVTGHGWHYVVRVQGQTRCQDEIGCTFAIKDLAQRGRQIKLRGQAFKKHGWRPCSVAVRWDSPYQEPLCVVSDLPHQWALLDLYRRRFAIEASFRHDKSYGWHLEQCQVRDPAHLEHLLVGMALATWLTVLVGTQSIDQERAAHPKAAQRQQRKYSIFTLGLRCLQRLLAYQQSLCLTWQLVWQPETALGPTLGET